MRTFAIAHRYARRAWQRPRARPHGEYLDKLRLGTLSADEIAALELPWQPAMADVFRTMAAGTCAAVAARAVDHGVGRPPRRRSPSCLRESWRGILPAERHRRRRPVAQRDLGVRRRGGRRSRRAPRQRHRDDLRARRRRVHASRSTSSTTTRCSSRGAISTSACRTGPATRSTSRSWRRALPAVLAHAPDAGGVRGRRRSVRARPARRAEADEGGPCRARSPRDRRVRAARRFRSSSCWLAAMRTTSETPSTSTSTTVDTLVRGDAAL